MTLIRHIKELGGTVNKSDDVLDNIKSDRDETSIDYSNDSNKSGFVASFNDKENKWTLEGISVTGSTDYLLKCIEMNLAQEHKVIKFDFYNDWINGLLYIPRWARNVTKKHTYLWGIIKVGGKVKACNENFKSSNINFVQRCALTYNIDDNNTTTPIGCVNDSDKTMKCHKSDNATKKIKVFQNTGIVASIETLQSQYVYYFKPYERSISKTNLQSSYIRLFATDIVLLGSLNDCNKWGIPNAFTELVNTTYQLPPNIVLTDSEDDDVKFTSEVEDITMLMSKNNKITSINLNDNGINLEGNNGNYTEVSGIEWSYNGPQQETQEKTPFYKPGGHFLGLTCRNSETSIKTCVNLSRICEHGVWMSQQQTITVPKYNLFTEYNYIPSGFISKDEISKSIYRSSFATMNKNGLKTTINPETGFPMYEFKYINPSNFGGELNNYVFDDVNMNRNDGYNLMRTGEFRDEEYLKFRLGLNSFDLDEYKKRFAINDNNLVSLPKYDNSFYFYFGLHNGKTALDEFKKTYYAVCEKNNLKLEEVKINDSDFYFDVKDVRIDYTGICDENYTPTGKITFQIECEYEGIDISWELKGSKNTNTIENGDVVNFNEDIVCSDLEGDTYEITLKAANGLSTKTYKDIYVEKIKVESEVQGVDFKSSIDGLSPDVIVNTEREGDFGG
jgi:hypothetical protein